MPKKISPTAYAILGLLAARPWSAYEIARHMKTSSNLSFVWPRAESKIYQAPKALEEAGWASSRKAKTGGRTRTVYRITAKGRRALRAWLDEPAAPPHVELEDALKVAYATAGDIDQLRASLRRIRVRTLEATTDRVIPAMEGVLERDFAIPERAHTSALVAELVGRVAGAITDWALWAEDAIEDWEDIEIDDAKRAWALSFYADRLKILEERQEMLKRRHGEE
jgi:PadR family transcriptional regulator AphA